MLPIAQTIHYSLYIAQTTQDFAHQVPCQIFRSHSSSCGANLVDDIKTTSSRRLAHLSLASGVPYLDSRVSPASVSDTVSSFKLVHPDPNKKERNVLRSTPRKKEEKNIKSLKKNREYKILDKCMNQKNPRFCDTIIHNIR